MLVKGEGGSRIKFGKEDGIMKDVMKILVFMLIGTFFLWSVPVQQVQAVVKDRTITGLPPNTMITITLPDGATEEKETDDKGALVFPFPKGKSHLTWDGGSQVVKIPGFWTPTTMGAAAIVVVGAGVAIANSGGDGGRSSGGGDSVPSIIDIPGSYTGTGTRAQDTCGGGRYPSTMNISNTMTTSDSQVTVHSNADVTGTYCQDTGNFSGSAVFTLNGNPIEEEYDGKFKNGSIVFTGTLTYTDLDGPTAGCTVSYNVTLTKS